MEICLQISFYSENVQCQKRPCKNFVQQIHLNSSAQSLNIIGNICESDQTEQVLMKNIGWYLETLPTSGECLCKAATFLSKVHPFSMNSRVLGKSRLLRRANFNFAVIFQIVLLFSPCCHLKQGYDTTFHQPFLIKLMDTHRH